MKLNEEEMYNAHPWLLTVPRVGISFIFLKLVYKSSPSLGHCLPKPWALPPHRLGIASPTLGHCVPNIVGQDKIIG